MNRIFKYSSLVAVTFMAICSCSDDLTYLSPDSGKNYGNNDAPFGSIRFRTGAQSRAEEVSTENLSAVEATAYIDIEQNEFKFEKYLFDKRNEKGYLICDKNPQWPGIHRYRKPNEDGSYPDGTTEDQKIPEKYSDWKKNPFDDEKDKNYALKEDGKEYDSNKLPDGYVYLEDYNDSGWIYIIDYDEDSTLNVFVYSPTLEGLRDAFNSGTQGKPGSTGLMLTPPIEVYDFFNTYIDGVGLTPPVNYNEHTELKIYYQDGVPQDGYKLGMFHVAQDISREVDFVTANVQKARRIIKDPDKTFTDENGNEIHPYTLEPVPVTLEHQLCNIEIKAKNGNADYDVDVAGVMIGRAMVYGPMFNLTTNDWEFPPLTRQDLYSIVTYAYSPDEENPDDGDYIQRLGPDAVTLMGNGGNAMVLPTKLEAWDYKDSDNADAFNFNNGDRPIMFLAALVRVLPKNNDNDNDDTPFSYPFGYPFDSDWKCVDEEGGVWSYIGYDWGYFGDDCWYYYNYDYENDSYEFEDKGWKRVPETGEWTYVGNDENGTDYDNYKWLLNWKVNNYGDWTYIGEDWEMLTDENGDVVINDDYEVYWKYKGNYTYDSETGTWIIPKDVIFPSKNVINGSNFETQEFAVLRNASDPGRVLGHNYNDRDKSTISDEKKEEYRNKNKDTVFETYAWVGFPVAVDWEKGHKYVYTLDFTSGLGVEIPNGIYGGRLISDIIKLFENTKKPEDQNTNSSTETNPSPAKSRLKMNTANLPKGWGSVEMESSVWEPEDVIIKKK